MKIVELRVTHATSLLSGDKQPFQRFRSVAGGIAALGDGDGA